VRAAYPGARLRYRHAVGAYVAGVGVNSVLPARGGDVVKLYLVKHRTEGSTYPTLASTLVVETIFDFFVAGGLMIWALSIGVLPTHQVYARIPTVDWKFFLLHERATLIGLGLLAGAGGDRVLLGPNPSREVLEPRSTRFRDSRRPPTVCHGRARAADDLLGLPDRDPVFLPRGVPRPRVDPQCAARPGRRLAGNALPGDAWRCRDEAGA